jgi:hypothetical protein
MYGPQAARTQYQHVCMISSTQNFVQHDARSYLTLDDQIRCTHVCSEQIETVLRIQRYTLIEVDGRPQPLLRGFCDCVWMHYVKQPQRCAVLTRQERCTACRSVSVERKVARGQNRAQCAYRVLR